MPRYELRLGFTADNDIQAERIGSAWAQTVKGLWGASTRLVALPDGGDPHEVVNSRVPHPPYRHIADTLKREVAAGQYADELPGAAVLAERFNVNIKTAGRAIQQLVAEGVAVARPGMRATPVLPDEEE